MKKIIIFIIIIFILVFVIGIFFVFNLLKKENKSVGLVAPVEQPNNFNISTSINTGKTYDAKTDDQASITVTVTPKELGLDREKNIFVVSFNTHSVELNFDVEKDPVLKDDLGNIYKASRWTGGVGGHHLSGNLEFPKINKEAKKIELQINNVGKVSRKFNWDL